MNNCGTKTLAVITGMAVEETCFSYMTPTRELEDFSYMG